MSHSRCRLFSLLFIAEVSTFLFTFTQPGLSQAADTGGGQGTYAITRDGDMSTRIVLKLESFHSCQACPAYELNVYGDGTSHFIGRDAVRRLGEAGSSLSRDRQSRLMAAHGIDPAKQRAAWRERFGDRLAQVQGEIESLSTRYGSLSASAIADQVDAYAVQRPQRMEITRWVGDGVATRTVFYTGAKDSSRLAQLALRIQGLHRDWRDFDPMPPFADDEEALLSWTHLWPWGETPGCRGNVGDAYALLYRSGQVVIYWHRLELPMHAQDEIEAYRRQVAAPAYSRTQIFLPPAERATLLALIERQSGALAGSLETDQVNGPPGNWNELEPGAEIQYAVKSKRGVSRFRLYQSSVVSPPPLTSAVLRLTERIRQSLPPPGKASRQACAQYSRLPKP